MAKDGHHQESFDAERLGTAGKLARQDLSY